MFKSSRLEKTIDDIISADFLQIEPLTKSDLDNTGLKRILYFLNINKSQIKYMKKVHSTIAPVVPEIQIMIGFNPTDGLCFVSKHEKHKKFLCGDYIRELLDSCPLVHSLQYMLLDPKSGDIWAYVPPKCNKYCPVDSQRTSFRQFLFSAK